VCNKRSILHVDVRLGVDFAGSQKNRTQLTSMRNCNGHQYYDLEKLDRSSSLKWMFASIGKVGQPRPMKEHILRISWPYGRYGVYASDINCAKAVGMAADYRLSHQGC
jgi:hypothetical protein